MLLSYKKKIRLQADQFLSDWKSKGVQTDICPAITVSSSLKSLVTALYLKESERDNPQSERDNPQSVTINNLASAAVVAIFYTT